MAFERSRVMARFTHSVSEECAAAGATGGQRVRLRDAGVVRALLSAGAATDIRGPAGKTPAQYAREAGHEALAAELGAA